MTTTPDLSKYAWADYLHCMDGLPDPMILRSPQVRRGPSVAWGVACAVIVALAAVWISELPFPPFTLSGNRHPIEGVMLAIILGMILANLLPLPKLLQPGLKLTTKKLLPLAVILLGARLDFVAVLRVGAQGLAMSVGTIILGMGLFLLFIRWGWVSRKLGMLLGVGTAICGGTAIVAAAPIIDADDKDVTFSVATVTLCGLATMFLLPLLGQIMHLSDTAFGIWAGLSIHQTPQVIAAGFAYSQGAGDTATIVKLARVCLLAPVLLLIGWQMAKSEPGTGQRVQLLHVFPMFVIGFLAMALLRTGGMLPDLTIRLPETAMVGAGTHDISVVRICDMASKFLIVAAMAAVGLETRFKALRQTGVRPLVLAFGAAIIICTVILATLALLGS